jgi:putative ABC transport system permease protein
VELGAILRWRGDSVRQQSFPYATYKALRSGLAGPEVEEVAASNYAAGQIPVGRGERARSAKGLLVSGSYFRLLGVRPALGRFFLPDEDVEPLGAPVVVIGHGYWRREFGGAPGVLGRHLDIGTRRYTIVGVAPRGFTGTELGAVDVWLPISSAQGLRFGGADWATTVQSTWIRVFVRVAPGAPRERVEARATVINREAGEPRMARLQATISAVPLAASIRASTQGVTARVAALLGIVSGLVLLIACANVANLLLARALRRRHEIAVRLAVGASRGRIVAPLLAESLVLALLGGAAALLIAQWGGELLRAVVFGDLRWEEAPVDGRVLAFTALAATLTGAAAGLIPAIQASRTQPSASLTPRGTTASHGPTRAALVAAQAALAVVLLVGTGLFVRSLRNLRALPLGMQPDQVLLATMNFGPLGLTPVEVDALFRRMEERVRALPGVGSAAAAVTVPGRGSYQGLVLVPGRDSLPVPPGGGPFMNAVRPGFFATMGTRILRGRDFTEADESSKAPVVIVNETMARVAWPGEDALGKCVRLGSDSAPCAQVVGVSENSRRQDWIEDEIFHLHLPLAQAPDWMGARLLVVRPAAGGRAERLAADVRRVMQTAGANLPYAEVRPLAELYARELRPWRLGAMMFGAFGVLAVLLAAVGLYGVMALSVAQRTRELGVRIALGARRGDVMRLVVRQGVGVVALGTALGLAAALGGAGRVESLLFRVSPRDPMVFGGVAVVLLLVGVAASLVPSWRATRVNPSVALRAE